MESNTKYLIIGIVVVVLCCLSSIGGGVGWYFFISETAAVAATEAPKTDTPKTEAPKTEAPKTEPKPAPILAPATKPALGSAPVPAPPPPPAPGNPNGSFSGVWSAGSCRGAGWDQNGWPRAQGLLTQNACQDRCLNTPGCTAYDIARPQGDTYDCWLFGHTNVIGDGGGDKCYVRT